MAGRSFHSQFRPVLGQGSGQRWPPPLEQFQSSTEIRLWLPQIQKEIEVCLQRSQDAWEFASSPILSLQRKSKKPNVDSLWHHQCVEDSAQPTDKAADFQLQASQLQDYYQACEGRLRELEGEETSSMSDSVLVTVTHHVSVTAANEEPKGSDDEASHSSSLLSDVSCESMCSQLVSICSSFETESCSD